MASSTIALPTVLQMLLGLYGYLLPTLLYVLWSTLAIFLLPFVGAIAYLLLGGGQMSQRSRIIAVGGGAAAYFLILLVGAAAGGVS
jgi:hypothetical protein